MVASVGEKFTYGHANGLGYGEALKADAGYGELSAEMKELDLRDGQEVTLFEYDADSEWPIIEWTDSTGINRLTTIEPDIFDSYFQSAEASR